MTQNNLKWPKNDQTWGRGSEPIGALVISFNFVLSGQKPKTTLVFVLVHNYDISPLPLRHRGASPRQEPVKVLM